MEYCKKVVKVSITYNHKYGNNNEFSTKTKLYKGLDNWQWVIGKGFIK